jgi:hypothetical protein
MTIQCRTTQGEVQQLLEYHMWCKDVSAGALLTYQMRLNDIVCLARAYEHPSQKIAIGLLQAIEDSAMRPIDEDAARAIETLKQLELIRYECRELAMRLLEFSTGIESDSVADNGLF